MNSSIAAAAGLALYLAVAAPLFVLAWSARARAAALGVFGIGLLAILVLHSGWVGQSSLAPFDIRDIESAALSGGSSECGQVMQLLTEAGVILDRPTPRQLVVARRLWSEMPPAVREVTTACAEETRPADGGDGPIEIISR